MYVWRGEELKQSAGGGNEQIRRGLEEGAEVLGGGGASTEKQLGYHFERGGRERGLVVGGLIAGL